MKERSYRQAQFDEELERMLREARNAGHQTVDIVSKDLHDRVVPSDERNNRMPMACNAMWKLWNEKEQGSDPDNILHTTPSNKSSTLKIRFHLI